MILSMNTPDRQQKEYRPTLSVIGAGAAGGAIALALKQAGYPVSGIASRSLASAESLAALIDCDRFSTDAAEIVALGEIVIISTPDGAVSDVCREIAARGSVRQGQCFLHLSGALASDALNAAASAGADCLSFHPIQTLANPLQGAELLRGACFCLEGGERALETGRSLVAALEGEALVIDREMKPLYHAALCFSSNYLVALEAIAVDLLGLAGITPDQALKALMPLIQGTAANLRSVGLPDALTGPISRGDADTVRKHLQSLEETPASVAAIYRLLGTEAARLTREKGKFDREGLAQIERMLAARD